MTQGFSGSLRRLRARREGGYGAITAMVWVYCAHYHWRDWLARTMKGAAVVMLVLSAALACVAPLADRSKTLYLISSLSEILQWGLVVNTALLTWRTIRSQGPLGRFLVIGGTELCVCLAMERVITFHEPILAGWFPEVGFMAFIVILFLGKLADLSTAYRFRLTYNERVRQTEHLLTLEQAHYVRLQEKIEETRRVRHDLRQHLRLIQSMLSRGETEELTRYLERYTKTEQPLLSQPLQFCQIQAVDAILSYYWDMTRRLGADFQFEGQVPPLPEELHVDLCTLLGNLLENALEGVQKQEGGECFIHIRAHMVQGKLVLQVSNSFSTPVQRRDQRFYSSKREEPGIGTLSVAMIAQRYGGLADFSDDGQVFTARVFIPIPADRDAPAGTGARPRP